MRTGSAAEPVYMDIVEVGQYLGIVRAVPGDRHPERTLRRQTMRIYMMVHRKQIPHHKIGKRLFFDKREIDAWMREGRVPVRS